MYLIKKLDLDPQCAKKYIFYTNFFEQVNKVIFGLIVIPLKKARNIAQRAKVTVKMNPAM